MLPLDQGLRGNKGVELRRGYRELHTVYWVQFSSGRSRDYKLKPQISPNHNIR